MTRFETHISTKSNWNWRRWRRKIKIEKENTEMIYIPYVYTIYVCDVYTGTHAGGVRVKNWTKCIYTKPGISTYLKLTWWVYLQRKFTLCFLVIHVIYVCRYRYIIIIIIIMQAAVSSIARVTEFDTLFVLILFPSPISSIQNAGKAEREKESVSKWKWRA